MNDGNDVIRVDTDPTLLDAAQWNALLLRQPMPTPFMRMEYLAAMHSSASALAATGWSPCFVTIRRDAQLVAAAPVYLKDHSYGEYVFDWAWAEAYQRHGLRYYPKLLVAVPFTPVPGARLMAVDDRARLRLVRAIGELACDHRVSSVHLLFPDPRERAATAPAGWMRRQSVQFHWSRAAEVPSADFAGFIGTLHREKRKKILQERRRVAESGIDFTVHEAQDIDDRLWSFFHRCYVSTYQAHGSTPYLTREFFRSMARTMPEHWVMFVARRGSSAVAASLLAIDRASGVAYGRYWGATEYVPCLHFEACYYQPLQWCIAQGFHCFQGGAQGEHKMARGLLPVATESAHWLAHPQFAQAVEDYLRRERAGVDHYIDELREHSPFRPGG